MIINIIIFCNIYIDLSKSLYSFSVSSNALLLRQCIPLELRKYIDKKINLELSKSSFGDSYLLLKDINYATQIIEYYKIKNYSVCNDYYELCKKCKTKQEEINLFNKYKRFSYDILKQYTDEALLKEKIAKLSIKQND